jgi:hypothetical protein
LKLFIFSLFLSFNLLGNDYLQDSEILELKNAKKKLIERIKNEIHFLDQEETTDEMILKRYQAQLTHLKDKTLDLHSMSNENTKELFLDYEKEFLNNLSELKKKSALKPVLKAKYKFILMQANSLDHLPWYFLKKYDKYMQKEYAKNETPDLAILFNQVYYFIIPLLFDVATFPFQLCLAWYYGF